ncbi:MAG TPA: glycosyltransferase family 2 protein [Flavisolibacter sp.]|nr:glycosyltransferase family 2 protein [Flavisolibacter sp.]
MRLFKNPSWIHQFEYNYTSFDEIPQQVFDEINLQLDKKQSDHPEVSIVVTAYNEEVDILKTVGSLAHSNTKVPFEIIVVNNNSKDQTQKTLDKLHIRTFFQPKQGWGPGRQMGQENARGKYILLADSDCIYPATWIDNLLTGLKTPGVVSVYGRYSFISETGFPRWQLSILETMKDFIAGIRHVKRPFLNSYGMSMGYIKELGLKEGFYNNNTRGEDGRMCYDLMKYGKVKQIKAANSRVWTGPRTLKKDGSLTNALKIRIIKEVKRFSIYFTKRMKYLSPKD